MRTAEEMTADALSVVNPPDLVNENPSDRYTQDALSVLEDSPKNAGQVRYLPPKTWFGEFTHGFSRGVDQLQQTGYGVGALASDAVGLDTARDYFTKAVEQQDKEIAQKPGTATSYDQVDSFDSFMRYAFGSAGEVAPNLIESIGTGIAGAVAGSAAGPEGTAAGGIGGLITRKATRDLVKAGVKDLTEDVVKNQARKVAGQYGATTALALSSWGQETGGIYNDMKDDPNIPESDKKIAAVIGGFVAAAPETFMEGWITSKFFKGAKEVAKADVKEAENYAVRFMKEYGKEIMKVAPGEGGQEFAQTVVEEAAKNWADPNRRDAIFSFTDDQKKQFIDASFKGAIGGLLGGGVAAHAETKMPQHPNPAVRINERDTMQKAEDLSPPIDVAIGEDDKRLGAIATRRDEIQTQLAKAETTPEQRAILTTELASLDATENEILGEGEQDDKVESPKIQEPLVNEKVGKPGYRHLGTPQSEDYLDKGGWKLHLTVKPENYQAVDEWLDKNHAGQYKLLTGGDVGEKDFTIYVGHRDEANTLAAKIKDEIGSKVEDSAVGSEDLKFNEKVAGRFDDRTRGNYGTSNYGIEGVPHDKQAREDAMSLMFAKQGGNPDEIAKYQAQYDKSHERNKKAVIAKYGDRFTGTGVVNKPVRTQTPLERAIGHLRAFYAKEMPIKSAKIQVYQATPEARATKQAEIDTLVNENGQGDEKYTASMKAAFTPDVVNMFASEGVKLESAVNSPEMEGDDNFGVFIRGEDIIVAVPTPKTAADITTNYETTGDLVSHETIHAADLIQIRDKWRNGDRTQSLADYEATVMKDRGSALRKALPSLPMTVRQVYDPTGKGGLSDRALGQEMTRMMVELARKGNLSEATQAIVRTAQEEEAGTLGPVKNFLTKWMQAIRNLHDTLVKMFDPRKSPPQLVQAFHQIDQVLDRYGVLVNERVQREVQPLSTQESQTTPQEEVKTEEVPPAEEAKPAPEVVVKPKKTERIQKRRDKADKEVKAQKKKQAAKSNKPRVILGPALLNEDGSKRLGTIGQTHAQLKLEAAKEGEDFTDARHMFHDSHGNLLSRSEAFGVAQQSGQLNEDGARKVGPEAQLESQDLQKPTTWIDEALAERRVQGWDDRWPFVPADLSNQSFVDAIKSDPTLSDEEKDRILSFAPSQVAWREGDKSPAKANRPKMTKRDTKVVQDAVKAANVASNKLFSGLQVKESQTERVKGEVPFAGATPQQLYYTTRPHTESAVDAQRLVNENGGALEVAEGLQEFPMGEHLSITEDDNGDHGPNSKLKAVYENVITQLVNVEKRITAKEASTGALGYIRSLRSDLENKMRRLGNAAGSYNAYTGMSDNLITGETARKEYVQALVSNANKVIAGDAKVKLKKLANELNDLWQKYGGTVVNHPKIIATLRKIQKMVDSKNFAKGYRQTVVKNLAKLKGIVNKAAARASDHMSMAEDEEAYVNRAIERVVSEMTGVPKAGSDPLSEHHLVLKVLSSMTRQIGKQMGIITPSAKEAKISTQDQMAAVLKNEGLYAEFTRGIYEAYVREYGGANPEENTSFMEEADTLYARLSNRMWQEDMVSSLVNEKMQELNLKFAEIVKDKYNKGQFAVDQIRDAIASYMKDQGVENDSLINQLAEDIESEMNDNIEAAREKFFTSKKTIKDFLRNMQTTLSKAAKEHSTYVDSVKYEFAKALQDDYGFPNTAELPIASMMANSMQSVFNEMVQEEREKIVKRWMDAETKDTPKVKAKKQQAVDQVLALANTGALRTEDAYQALAKKFDLPPYSEETAKQMQDLGDQIGEAQTERQKAILKQTLADLLTSKKGLKTSDSYTSWMYFSMLSGIGTPLVNIGGNLTTLMGYVTLEAIKHPTRLPRMLNALVRTAMGKGAVEFRESFFTGMALGKQGEKYYRTGNPAELSDPFFKSKFSDSDNPIFQAIGKRDEQLAEFTHKVIRGVKGQYVGRFLMATDLFFYKVAEEAAYASRVTEDAALMGTPEMWNSAMTRARSEMFAAGQNPDENSDMRRRQLILAHSIFEDLRMRDKSGDLVNERVTAWTEANSEALDATFSNEPRYFLGYLAKHIERFTNDQPIGKLLIPFTRVAANVTNHMLEWTPYGFARYALLSIKEGQIPFMPTEGEWKSRSDVALRAALGTASVFALLAMAAHDRDEDDPYFTIYGDGPRDFNARRMMQEKGWKPNSIKVGNAYLSYLYTPLAMALAIVGRHLDDYRDGRIVDPRDISLATSAVALIEAVKNQSFLASVSDLMASVDSPDPQAKVSKVFARIATIPIPNLIKQVDRVVDPSIQQAQGFAENWIKELPIARHTLKPALNVFGQEIQRTPGIVRFPGVDRFITMEKTSDPVLNLISERNLKVPGISKSTRLGNEAMNPEQYYKYVQLVGPRVYSRLQAELYSLRAMAKDEAQDRIERISLEEKKKARAEMLSR